MKKTISILIAELQEKLTPVFPPEIAGQHAWWLLEKLTGKKEVNLIARDNLELSPDQEKLLEEWLHKIIVEHMPIQYVLGSVEFLDLIIKVEPPILIPRPETEEWCEELISRLKKQANSFAILDLCTGTGCIALALAQAFPKSSVTGTDISDQALKLAQINSNLNGLTNLTFIKSDIYQTLDGKRFDIIVANPPYIDPHEWENLDNSVKDWEDPKALIAPDNGLAVIKKIISGANNYLKQRSLSQVWIEIDYTQAKKVSELFLQAGAKKTEIWRDLYSRDRVVIGYFA